MIRPAAADDAGQLARVFVAAWRSGYRGVVADAIIDGLDIDEWTHGFANRLEVGDLTSIVWDEGLGGILGFARFGADPDDRSPTRGYLASLYVDPEASGHGIGTALLTQVIASLAAAGRTEVGLWVFTANEPARTLRARGFHPHRRDHDRSAVGRRAAPLPAHRQLKPHALGDRSTRHRPHVLEIVHRHPPWGSVDP